MSNRAFFQRLAECLLDTAMLFCTGLLAILLTWALGLINSHFLMVIGFFVAVFATSALLKYATVVTRSLALGQEVPVPDSAIFDYFRNAWAFAPWFGLLAVNVVGLFLWQTLGTATAVIFVLVLAPLVPAGIAVAALTRRFWLMFHVPGLVRVVRALGPDYWRILVTWLALALFGAVLRGQGGFAFSFLTVWVGCLTLMAVFVATGIALFHHHEALGIPVERKSREDRQQQAEDAALLRQRRQVLDQAYGYFSRENRIAGLQRLKHYFEDNPDDDAGWDWFINEMFQWEDRTPGFALARNRFAHLAERDDEDAARALLMQCRGIDADFEVHPQDRVYARSL